MRAQLIELTPDSAELVAEGEIVEQRLDDVLAVVERALDRDRVDVRLVDRRHLPALHVGDAAVREEDEDVGARAAAEGLDRRRAGVARGRAEDRRAPVAPLQRAVHRAPEPLHGEILERERRPVEQFEQEQVVVDLDQRRGRGVAEAGIGVARQAGELVGRKILADERRDQPGRRFGIGQAGEGADRRRGERRQALRHVEAPVAGEPGEHRVAEIEPRRFAAGGEVTHVFRIPEARACVV